MRTTPDQIAALRSLLERLDEGGSDVDLLSDILAGELLLLAADLLDDLEELRGAALANGFERDEANDRLEKIEVLLRGVYASARVMEARKLARPAHLVAALTDTQEKP